MPTDPHPADVELVAKALRNKPVCVHIIPTTIMQSARCDECTAAAAVSALAAANRLRDSESART